MKLSPSVFRSLIFLFFSLSVVTMQAQEPKRKVIPDSIRISLLTCASGEEIYSPFRTYGYTVRKLYPRH